MSRPAKGHTNRNAPAGNSAALASAITASAGASDTPVDPDDRLLTLRRRWLAALTDLNRLLDQQRLVEKRCEERDQNLPDTDEPIQVAIKRRRAAIEREEGLPELQAAIIAAHEEEDLLLRVIALTPAHTLRGLAVKVEASASRQHGEQALVTSIMTDILTLGALADVA